MTLEIFTPCFFETAEPVRRCAESCRRLGYKQTLYGVGENWPNLYEATIVRMLAEIEKSTANLVCRADGQDAWFLREPAALLEAFESYNCDILIGGERLCWPLAHMANKFDQNTQYPFPNSGNWIGKREAVIDALRDLTTIQSTTDLEGHASNDQALWVAYFKNYEYPNAQGLAVDTEAHAFFSTSNDDFGSDSPWMRQGDKLVNGMTDAEPCLIHFNGGGNKAERIAEFDRVVGL